MHERMDSTADRLLNVPGIIFAFALYPRRGITAVARLSWLAGASTVVAVSSAYIATCVCDAFRDRRPSPTVGQFMYRQESSIGHDNFPRLNGTFASPADKNSKPVQIN